jgi:hypothetical protein
MVKFFIKTGDPQVDSIFMPYMWGKQGLRELIEAHVNTASYGDGLKLLLIKIYVEGRFNIHAPENLIVEKYSRTKEETSAAFAIRQTDFYNKSEEERKSFLATMVQASVDKVRLKLEKRLDGFDFNLLQKNIDVAMQLYLK